MTGFPDDLFRIFTDLEADNSKAFWEVNKTRWADQVRGPTSDLARELSFEFGELRLFRPHRDVRFSREGHLVQTVFVVPGAITSSPADRAASPSL